eukprot:Platyproteum_vivax@DN582_c0_g1_i3.p1
MYEPWYSRGDPLQYLQTGAELSKKYPNVGNYKSQIFPLFPESWQEMLERSERTIKHILSHTSGNCLIVSHGFIVEGLICSMVPEHPHQKVPFCSITQISTSMNRETARRETEGKNQIAYKRNYFVKVLFDCRHLTYREKEVVYV